MNKFEKRLDELARGKNILENKEHINTKDEYGMVALNYAAIDAKKDNVKLLIDLGADVNIKNELHDEWSAIDYAAYGMKTNYGHRWSIIVMLIEAGAKNGVIIKPLN